MLCSYKIWNFMWLHTQASVNIARQILKHPQLCPNFPHLILRLSLGLCLCFAFGFCFLWLLGKFIISIITIPITLTIKVVMVMSHHPHYPNSQTSYFCQQHHTSWIISVCLLRLRLLRFRCLPGKKNNATAAMSASVQGVIR